MSARTKAASHVTREMDDLYRDFPEEVARHIAQHVTEVDAASYRLRCLLGAHKDNKGRAVLVRGAWRYACGSCNRVLGRAHLVERLALMVNPLIRPLRGSKLYVDLYDAGRHVHFNQDEQWVKDYSRESVEGLLRRFNMTHYFDNRTEQVELRYEPYGPVMSTDSAPVLNIYTPPAWRKNHFYRGTAVEAVATIPKKYELFLKHFTAGDDESYQYLLDWLAYGLRHQNQTVLCAIGEEGIGKGILGDIMRAVHGDSNYVKTNDAVFKRDFNSELENKTFVFIDEPSLIRRGEVNVAERAC